MKWLANSLIFWLNLVLLEHWIVWVHHLREDLSRLLWAGHSYSPPRHVYKLFDGQLIRLNWYWIHQNIHHISYLLVFQGPKDSMYTRKKFQGLIKMMEYHLSYFRICLLKISKASNVCSIICNNTHAESLIKYVFRFANITCLLFVEIMLEPSTRCL